MFNTPRKFCCRCLLELPHPGDSNKYPHHTFLGVNKGFFMMPNSFWCPSLREQVLFYNEDLLYKQFYVLTSLGVRSVWWRSRPSTSWCWRSCTAHASWSLTGRERPEASVWSKSSTRPVACVWTECSCVGSIATVCLTRICLEKKSNFHIIRDNFHIMTPEFKLP